jgi:hypothetical protein
MCSGGGGERWKVDDLDEVGEVEHTLLQVAAVLSPHDELLSPISLNPILDYLRTNVWKLRMRVLV